MNNNDEELPTTDTAQIERLIERFKQGRLEPGDAQLIEKLLRLLLTIISFLQGKNSTLLRLKEFLFGGKKRKPDSDKSKDSGEEKHGAAVSGILLSMIESCRLNGGNPWEYLLVLIRHKDEARRNPAAYLPWNYPRQETGVEARAEAA
jgi:hypothetical protein